MNRLATVLLCLLLCGCVPPPKPEPDVQPDKPEPSPVVIADRAAICDELADMIDAGRIKTTDDLVRVFALLQDGKDWESADSTAVDAVLPGLPTAKRALTAEDSAKLRGVK